VTFTKEKIWMECDRLTREKGYIHKMIAIHDLRNFGKEDAALISIYLLYHA
jgi:hypothetical protein